MTGLAAGVAAAGGAWGLEAAVWVRLLRRRLKTLASWWARPWCPALVAGALAAADAEVRLLFAAVPPLAPAAGISAGPEASGEAGAETEARCNSAML